MTVLDADQLARIGGGYTSRFTQYPQAIIPVDRAHWEAAKQRVTAAVKRFFSNADGNWYRDGHINW